MAEDGRAAGISVNGLLPGAMTRGHASVDHSLTPSGSIDMRPELVAPAAAFLVHEECAVTGRFYAANSARMGRVFTAAVEGHQARPDEFVIETVRDHWATIDEPSNYVIPNSTQDFNEMRTRVFHAAVDDGADAS
jgi:hypothetical protein